MYQCRRNEDEVKGKGPTLHFNVKILPNGAMELTCVLPENLEARIIASLYQLEDFALREGRRLEIFMRRLARSAEGTRVTKIEEFCACLSERSGITITAETVHER